MIAALDVVIAVHEHLRLDDRDDLRRLAERRIACKRMGVRVDAVPGRDAGAISMTARHLANRAPCS